MAQEIFDDAEDAGDFEERADHVSEETLRTGTVTGDWFDVISKSLVARGTVFVIGPRGCGKTHMMRYAWLRCCEQKGGPLAVYVSFNRYLRLEPLLKTRTDALSLFQTWVLCRILVAANETAERLGLSSVEPGAPNIFGSLSITKGQVEGLVTRLERAGVLSQEEEACANTISIEGVVLALVGLTRQFGRARTVLLLDDAALVFTPEFMVEFFEIVRVLKRQDISPKCSVYPGTTEYGPRFHADHEGRFVPAWLPVDHPSYCEIMGNIGQKRYSGDAPGKDVNELLMYASFGVPRAYLTMLREIHSETSERGVGSQAAVNKVIQNHRDGRLREFRSLKLKMPKFNTVIGAGEQLFDAIIRILKSENEGLDSAGTKQLLVGIPSTDLTSLPSRMVKLLVEAGLLFESPEVSHGPDRKYRRFTPHLAALIAARAFSERSRGSSASQVVAFIQRRATKHPVRRSLESLLPASMKVQLDLPPCQSCKTPRLNEQQKFCHNCGSRLADDSTFTRLMKLPISDVTNLSAWARGRIQERGIKTIEELLAFDDPGTELRKIYMVGPQRAEDYLSRVEAYIDEFLS
ncbi:ORC-CDC6 family AAA ATPase [Bradyrhizobium sp. 930_D9_N1_4]|uniref:ORC-CDC6 family AAA ATPase n=1 Tax=Bradyrhizobium sp. 930_D9_N1_4 TaxID=3240374 RepID=UPI003F89E153